MVLHNPNERSPTMTQRIQNGAIVKIQGYEFVASDVEWTDEKDQFSGALTGRRLVRFTGTCTENPINNSIRGTAYDGGRYGGNTLAGYVESVEERMTFAHPLPPDPLIRGGRVGALEARMQTIATIARAIATADNCRTVAPAHVIRAALRVGHGSPSKPLTKALNGQRACGYRLTPDDWQIAILAMLSAGYLYIGHGGTYHYYEAPRAA